MFSSARCGGGSEEDGGGGGDEEEEGGGESTGRHFGWFLVMCVESRQSENLAFPMEEIVKG